MGRRPRAQAQAINRPLAIFATVLVVAGIAGVAWVSSLRSSPVAVPAAPAATSTASATGVVTTPALILVNDNAISLMAEDGTLERLTFEAFTQRAKDKRVPIEGSNVATGAVEQFRTGPKPADGTPQTFISPNGTYQAYLGAAQTDGAGVVVMQRGSETVQKIVLRQPKLALKDPAILGWFSDHELAVVVTATSSRAIYAVTSTDVPRRVAALPDGLGYLAARDGAVWYTTATPGEGIESPSKGPSEIHRLEANGANTMIARDELHVVTMVVPDAFSNGTRIAYTTDDGQSFIYATDTGKRLVLGTPRPLLFVGADALIVRDGYDLARYDTAKGLSQRLGALPEGNVDLFDAAPLLDAKP